MLVKYRNQIVAGDSKAVAAMKEYVLANMEKIKGSKPKGSKPKDKELVFAKGEVLGLAEAALGIAIDPPSKGQVNDAVSQFDEIVKTIRTLKVLDPD